MSCCGNKKDVGGGVEAVHNSIRAKKIYDVNDKNQEAVTRDYIPVKGSALKSAPKLTRQQNYGLQNPSTVSSKIGNINQLDFRLDQQQGVANTFDVPTFDYTTVLSHNIYSNKNSSVVLPTEQYKKKNNQPVQKNQTSQPQPQANHK